MIYFNIYIYIYIVYMVLDTILDIYIYIMYIYIYIHIYNINSLFSRKHFLKPIVIRFFQKPSSDRTLRKVIKTISTKIIQKP